MNTKINDVLRGRVIQISISESEDLEKLGYGQSHLIDAKIEIARHLLSAECKLMYGGDFRKNGFTNILIDLVEAYSNRDNTPHFHSYVNWPNDKGLTTKLKASFSEKIEVHQPGLPADITSTLSRKNYLQPKEPKHHYVWARALTYMREKMIESSNAHIALGGAITKYKGKYPGVIEEIYLASNKNQPIFLIGTFGGAASAIYKMMTGSLDVIQSPSSSLSKQAIEFFNKNKPKTESNIDFEEVAKHFSKIGVEGLNNGLSVDENERLSKSPHLPEIISLILKGLAAKFNSNGKSNS